MMTFRLVIAIFLFPILCFSQDQYLDSSFNGTGKFFLSTAFMYPYDSTENITDAVEQPDGKVVFLGTSFSSSGFFEPVYCTVFRLNVDGTLDNTFGNNGIFQYSTYTSLQNLFKQTAKMILQEDGSIIVSGVGKAEGGDPYQSDIIFIKLNPNGSMDTSFGNNGIARLPLNAGNNLQVYDIIIHNNLIYTAGRAGSRGFIGSIYMDGTVNLDLNSVGSLIIDNNTYYNDIQKLKIISNKLVGIGLSRTSAIGGITLSIAKIFPDGSMDSSYGTGGIADNFLLDETSEYILDCSMLPNDKIFVIVGGNFYQVNKYGNMDTSFGVNGFIKNPYNESFVTAIRTPDNKIILSKTKTEQISTHQSFKTVSINSGFTIDSGYYDSGQVITNVTNPVRNTQRPAKVLYLSSGKTLVAGTVETIPNPNVPSIIQEKYVVVRYAEPQFLHNQEISGNKMTIYPTKTSAILYFNTKEKIEQIEIYDQSGKLTRNVQGNYNKLYVTDLAKGVYVIRVQTSESVYTQKIIKE